MSKPVAAAGRHADQVVRARQAPAAPSSPNAGRTAPRPFTNKSALVLAVGVPSENILRAGPARSGGRATRRNRSTVGSRPACSAANLPWQGARIACYRIAGQLGTVASQRSKPICRWRLPVFSGRIYGPVVALQLGGWPNANAIGHSQRRLRRR